MTDLELKIKDAAQKYYTDGSSPLTDEEFDLLVDELKRTNPNSELLKTGWGYDVATDSTPGQKVKHKYGRAGSLEKCHNWEELGREFREKKVDLSLKLDGISCVLYYKNGQFVQALTRGDGITGIDITDKVKKIFNTEIRNKHSIFTGAIRGELLMTYENFEKFKEIYPDAKNPRNSTAGIINSKEITSDIAYISLILYTIVGLENECTMNNIHEIRDVLEVMFGKENVVPHTQYVWLLNSDMFIPAMNKVRDEWYGKYPADGIVITKAPIHLSVDNEVTYDACAFKFPAEEKDCEVEEVLWEMSKTRYAIPKIRIKTVQLSGTNVTYCTGYNAQYIRDNGIGCGAVVRLHKSGEIIPNICSIVKSVEPDMIDICPVCGEPLVWDGVHLKCQNSSCGNAVMQDTLVWMKNLAPIDGIGDTLKMSFLDIYTKSNVIPDVSIESIMESNKVLTESAESVQYNLFVKMWNKLHTGTFDMVDALVALNVPRISKITANKLANYPDIVKSAMDHAVARTKFTDEELLRLKAIGEANAKSVVDNLWKFARLKYIWDRIYNTFSYDTEVAHKGKIAITGKLSVKRADFEKELRAAGFTPADISRETCFLITDDPNSSSSKNKKADAWGIKKITEQEFRAIYL